MFLVGSAVVGIGTTALVLIFRRFGKTGAGGQRHVLLMVALLAFVLTMSMVFLLVARQ